jgi:hypothetical protein
MEGVSGREGQQRQQQQRQQGQQQLHLENAGVQALYASGQWWLYNVCCRNARLLFTQP